MKIPHYFAYVNKDGVELGWFRRKKEGMIQCLKFFHTCPKEKHLKTPSWTQGESYRIFDEESLDKQRIYIVPLNEQQKLVIEVQE